MKPTNYTVSGSGNPRRKFDLLVIITRELGPDPERKKLGVVELETIAHEHNIDISCARER